MKRREIIIIVITVIFAYYGIFDLVLTSGKKNADESASKAEPFDVAATLSGLHLANPYARQVSYVLSKIDAQLRHMPFMKNAAGLEDEDIPKETGQSFDADDFIYTGFAEMASERIAIINGFDYKKGETVKSFLLEEITPNFVILSHKQVHHTIPIEKELE